MPSHAHRVTVQVVACNLQLAFRGGEIELRARGHLYPGPEKIAPVS